jgi:hypothetical protein
VRDSSEIGVKSVREFCETILAVLFRATSALDPFGFEEAEMRESAWRLRYEQVFIDER